MLSTEAFDALSNEGKRAYLNRLANKIRDDVSDVASTMGSIIAERDAEIARLRAELESVTKERDASRLVSEGLHASNVNLRAELDEAKAESLGHENAAYGHRSDTQEARAEINEAIQQAHLILDHYAPPECTDRPTTLSSALTQIDGVMLATQRALSSARAALDKERAACDGYRSRCGSHREGNAAWYPCDEHSRFKAGDQRCDDCKAHDARRAAEAKEPPR